MKFTVVVFKLIFLLLEVEGSLMHDATVAMAKPQETAHSTTLGKNTAVPKVMHMSAQSTIPTKIVHAHAASTKLKVPMAALAGIKKSNGSKPSSKQSKKLQKAAKAFNKSNHWGLYDTQANATAANHTKAVQAEAMKSKDHAASSKKTATNASSNHTQDKKHVESSVHKATATSIPKALPVVNKDHSKESHELKVPTTKNTTASHVAAVKAAPKEAKPEMPKSTNQKFSNAGAAKVATKEVKSKNGTAASKVVNHATAIVKAAPNAPHVLVNAKSKTVSKSTAALGAQNKAEYQLLNFLASEMRKKELPPFEVYLPACLDHLHNLIDNLDMAYTDVQLHSVLVDECWLKKSFPESHDSSFSTDAACKKFATSLVNARYLELQMGSQEGYEGFCADYYVHIGGNLGKKKAEAPPPPKKKKTTQSFPWHFFVVAAVILILFAIILCMVVSKRQANHA